MVWLEIMGWDVGCKSGDEGNENIGDVARGFDGGWMDSRRGQKRIHKFKTQPLVEEDAETLFNLILGLGETWTAESATDEEYGSRGSGFVSGSTWSRSTGGAAYGDAYYAVSSGNHIEPSFTLPDKWTILVEKWSGSAWLSFGLTDDGDYWEDGTKNGSNDPALWLDTTTAAQPRFEGKNLAGTGASALYDQIHILPYRASDNFIAAYTQNTTALQGGLPFLTATGDYFGSSVTQVKKVFGVSVKKRPLQSTVGGSFNHVGRIVDFEFRE